MSESTKTIVFVAFALVVALGAVFSIPRPDDVRISETMIGEPLAPEFTDPLLAKSLEITRFDEELGELHKFRVAHIDGRWRIPSHSNYPADAENQMRDAATSLVGLDVLGIASQLDADHKLFGVIEPDSEKLSIGDEGVGLLVEMKDEKGGNLIQLIIGKQDKNSDDQRFVRIPGKSPVFVVAIDPEKLSTKFEDWIEKDLLQLNSFDVENVRFMDYSVTLRGGASAEFRQRSEAAMTFSSEKGEWTVDELLTFGPDRKPKPSELLPTEEVNTQRLNDLKTALDDLEIVDVARKPAGLGADLRAAQNFQSNQEALQSLAARGFYMLNFAGGPPELRSENGEVHVGMKDGVEYVLRFGRSAGLDDESGEGKLNRYMFVTARLDMSKIPEPELEEVPPAENEPPKPADQPQPDNADADKQDADKQDGADSETGNEEAKSDAQLERERIEKENQRKVDEYNEKKTAAEKKVKELQDRFADWYYVISEDVYKKIHLGRSEYLQESETAKEEGFGIDAFRQLESDGLQKSDPIGGGAELP